MAFYSKISIQFQIDWDKQIATCPEGKQSVHWYEHQAGGQYPRSAVLSKFKVKDCRDCLSRTKCVRNKAGHARHLNPPPRPLYEAQAATREILSTEKGRREYQNRAGIEGTHSQAVRRGTLRRARYRGLQKTYFQENAVATGINLLRTINFLNNQPIAKTRTSRFANLAH